MSAEDRAQLMSLTRPFPFGSSVALALGLAFAFALVVVFTFVLGLGFAPGLTFNLIPALDVIGTGSR